jgi:hypothetical protein
LRCLADDSSLDDLLNSAFERQIPEGGEDSFAEGGIEIGGISAFVRSSCV